MHGGKTGHVVSSPTAGDHTLQVTATDKAGNETTRTRYYRVDATAPSTTISAGPAKPFALSRSAAFHLASDDPAATFACKLDGGSSGTCTSAKTYAGLSAGTHTFSTRARDAVGNVDATPATWTWTLPHDERVLAASAAWTELEDSRFWRSTAVRTKAQDATLIRRDVRARRLMLVASTCDGCGTVDVFHGSTRLRRVSLDSASTEHRRTFGLVTYSELSTAKDVRIVVVSKGKPVTIDGIGMATR